MPRIRLAILTAFTACWAVMFCFMPLYVDDLWFGLTLRPWIDGSASGFPFSEIWNVYVHHWQVDNVRLANIFYVPTLLLPRWLPSIFIALAWGVAIYWLARLLELPKRGVGLFSLLLFFLAFALPWYDSIGALCYQFNYPLSSFVAIGAIYYAFRGRNWLIALLVGLILGAWHEGFGIPLLFGLGFAFLLSHQLRSPHVLALLIGILLGTAWLFISPAVTSRAPGAETIFSLSRFSYLLTLHPVFWLMLILIAISLFKKRGSQLASPLFIVFAISAIVSYGIHFATVNAPRAGWWCELASAAAVICLVKDYKVPRALPVLVGGLLLLLSFAHLIIVDVYSVRINTFYRQAVADYLKSPNGTVFASFTDEYQAPLLAWNMPDFTILLSRFSTETLAKYYDRELTPPSLVPAELQNFTATQGVPVSGIKSLCRVGDRLVVPATDLPKLSSLYIPQEASDNPVPGEFNASVDFGYKIKPNTRIIAHPFVSKADGNLYYYLYPWRCFLEMHLGSLKSITPQ